VVCDVCRSGPYSGFGTRALLDSKVYNAIYRIILFLVVQYMLPMMMLIALNTKVVISLRQATLHRVNTLYVESVTPSLRSAGGATPFMFESTRRVTLIVIVVVLLCIVCHLVAMVAQVLWSLEVAFSGSMSLSTFTSLVVCRRHFARASNVLVTLNSAANFIIYCMCSRNFRTVLVNRCFCCCRSGAFVMTQQRGDAAVGAGGDRLNDMMLMQQGHQRRAQQTPTSNSRQRATNERLLASERQTVRVDCEHEVGRARNIEMQLVSTAASQQTSY